jgi:hypothetical protein
MTSRQQYIMTKVQENIRSLRAMLDDVMYRNDPLPENEFKIIRACYDKICEANDLI